MRKRFYGPIILFALPVQKWPKATAVVGVEKFDETEGSVSLLTDHMNSIEKKLTEDEAAIAAHAPALKAATDAKDTAETKAADLQTKLTAAEQNATTLQNSINAVTTERDALKTKVQGIEAKLAARAEGTEEPGNSGAENGGEKPKYGWTAKNKEGKK
jgi:chromosome segregation ATPase